MRRIISSGSVKGFLIDREMVMEKLKDVSETALNTFPEILEIRVFGSFAKGEETGLSDIDIFILISSSDEKNPVQRLKKYFYFFSENLDIAVDVVVADLSEINNFKDIISNSILITKRK